MRDVSLFHKGNVADTCSVWNVLASSVLLRAARAAGCNFGITRFVLFECLNKVRTIAHQEDTELRRRLNEQREGGAFTTVDLPLDDLREVGRLRDRRRLGLGELSAIAFARRIGDVAFLSDDRGAQKLAAEVIAPALVQTTPHLLGWLVFTSRVSDGDVDVVVSQHVAMKRPLRSALRTMATEGLRVRCLINAR